MNESQRIATAVMVGLLAVTGGTGCRRVRRFIQRHRHAQVERRVSPARPGAHATTRPTRNLGPPALCEGARETAPATVTMQAPGPVEAVSVASLTPEQTLILVTAAGGTYVSTLAAPAFVHIGSAVAGDRESDPVLIAAGSTYAAVWRRQRGNAQFLVFARLDAHGAIEGEENAQQLDTGRPGAALTALEHGYAYGFVTAGAIGVQAVGANGVPTGHASLLPGSAGSTGIALTTVASDAVAAWTTETPDRSTITMARVDPGTGAVHPLSALVVHGGTARAHVVPVGSRLVMSLFDPSTAGTGPSAFTTAFEATGVRLVDPIALGEHTLEAPPALATDGERIAAAWTEEPTPGSTRVRWVRLNDRGELRGQALDVAGSTLTGAARVPAALSWDGDSFVLVRAGTGGTDQLAVHRFGPNGCDAR